MVLSIIVVGMYFLQRSLMDRFTDVFNLDLFTCSNEIPADDTSNYLFVYVYIFITLISSTMT